jgi:hypothetical protein
MIARIVGGMLDGQEQDLFGAEVVHPFMDREYTADYGEWFARWGVARAWRWAGNEPDDDIPPEPRMPTEVYRWDRDGDEFIVVFDRIER